MENQEQVTPLQEVDESSQITPEDRLHVLNVIFEVSAGLFMYLILKQAYNYINIDWSRLNSLSLYLGDLSDNWEIMIKCIKAPFRNGFTAEGIGLAISIIGFWLTFPKHKK